MLMNGKIIFELYYCINSAETKEKMAHYILLPHHIFISVKAFVVMLVPGGLQFLIISTCFAWDLFGNHIIDFLMMRLIFVFLLTNSCLSRRDLLQCDNRSLCEL